MRRTLPLLPLLLAATAAAALAPGGLAAARPDAPITLELRRTSVGSILADGRGFTLYAFTRDGHGADACMRIGGCPETWPLLATTARPVAGPGVRAALVGTIAIGAGRRQVTYAGHPLYGYVAASRPGETDYVGISQFGGSWPALNAAGAEVR